MSAIITPILLASSLALGAAGTITQMEASEEASEASKRAEDARQKQMELESSRKRREIIRQGIIARSQATATATNQGAQFSSSLLGSTSAITANAAYGVSGVNQSEILGQRIFAANRDLADAQAQGATGQGLSALGGMIGKNLGPIGQLTYGL